MNESEIRNKILAAISQRHHPRGLFYRRNVGSALGADGRRIMFGLPGQADIGSCLCGRFVEIEVKTEKGKQSEFRKKWQTAVEKAGGIYILARSVEEVIDALDQIAGAAD